MTTVADVAVKARNKKAGLGAVMEPLVDRAPLREPIRALGQAPTREPLRDDGIIRNRKGEPVSRTRTFGTDRLYIDPSMVPDGWSWEWKRCKLHNMEQNEDSAYMLGLQHNGWEPVLAENFPLLFTKQGTTGPIVVDGLMLMERPLELTRQAQEEVQRETAMRGSNATQAIAKDGPAYGQQTNASKSFARADRFNHVIRERETVTRDIQMDQ